jgi:hypothetical protein
MKSSSYILVLSATVAEPDLITELTQLIQVIITYVIQLAASFQAISYFK